MQRIVVLNPKGGSGKTTLAVNIAGYYAHRGDRPVLLDCDPQGSSSNWVRRRPRTEKSVRLITAYERPKGDAAFVPPQLPADASHAIVDTPAAMSARDMAELVQSADKILVPVMPSEVDIHACARCVYHLLIGAKVKRGDNRLGIVANRIKYNALSFRTLTRFLETLDIPLVATIRDSQNFTRSLELSLSLFEMKPYQVCKDLPQLQRLIDWIELPRGQSLALEPLAADEAVNPAAGHAA